MACHFLTPVPKSTCHMEPTKTKNFNIRSNIKMEAMTVSPPRSPNSPYLPSFLMGDLASPNQCSSSPMTPLRANSDYTRSSKSKIEGPPIVGLFDEISRTSPTKSQTSPNLSILEASYNQENIENKNNFWVVVYGFPPNQVAQVLAMFSQIGRVSEHSYPSNSNWIFIKYTSLTDMRKALNMNEKVLSGNVMIGVTERKHHEVFTERKFGNYCPVHGLYKLTYDSPESSFRTPNYLTMGPQAKLVLCETSNNPECFIAPENHQPYLPGLIDIYNRLYDSFLGTDASRYINDGCSWRETVSWFWESLNPA